MFRITDADYGVSVIDKLIGRLNILWDASIWKLLQLGPIEIRCQSEHRSFLCSVKTWESTSSVTILGLIRWTYIAPTNCIIFFIWIATHLLQVPTREVIWIATHLYQVPPREQQAPVSTHSTFRRFFQYLTCLLMDFYPKLPLTVVWHRAMMAQHTSVCHDERNCFNRCNIEPTVHASYESFLLIQSC